VTRFPLLSGLKKKRTASKKALPNHQHAPSDVFNNRRTHSCDVVFIRGSVILTRSL